jgi:hypothetical protein
VSDVVDRQLKEPSRLDFMKWPNKIAKDSTSAQHALGPLIDWPNKYLKGCNLAQVGGHGVHVLVGKRRAGAPLPHWAGPKARTWNFFWVFHLAPTLRPQYRHSMGRWVPPLSGKNRSPGTHKLLRFGLQVLSPPQATGILPPPQA